ncbi:response regulator [Thalassotalea sediminis]|uniref:response regulator n=1 Tax=Thalassotalea sediminis TaxID=1759089 RepID=UPI002572A255|nr:response regulator [Thalassotalea sediminis]
MDDQLTSSILIVDDSSTNIRVICNQIKDLGHKIHIAKDGIQALELLTEIKPSMILMDISMPNMDGFECCKRIKQSESRRDIPVLIISGSNDEKDMRRALNVGASAYMTKPIDPKQLRTNIDYHMPWH